MSNTLYYGDNLDILHQHIPDESVDLIYLDPPFNSNRNYNVLFKEESGKESEAQIVAFEDTWHWNQAAEDTYRDLVVDVGGNMAMMIGALRSFIGTNQMMAYLVMMAARLVELHRVLKPTGSLYLHCDPTASHYLKIVLDTVFGSKHFRNEIIWAYRGGGAPRRDFGRRHDVIFRYVKTKHYIFNADPIRIPYQAEGIERTDAAMWGKHKGDNKVYKPHPLGKIPEDWWPINPINANDPERLGYPTQKPLALLERIIQASSNEGDVILDPFAGCGTAIAAAQKLKRQWIGIDITHLAIALVKYRMEHMYPDIQFQVIGEPQDLSAARHLALQNRHQFEWWALSLVRARPTGATGKSKTGKKGADKGIDGIINFIDDHTNKPRRLLVQVKSGKVKSGDVRDLRGTVEREQAEMGLLITLEPPTKEMITEAVSAGHYRSPGWHQDFPKIQIMTIEQLLHCAKISMPPQAGTFKEAQRVQPDDAEQGNLKL